MATSAPIMKGMEGAYEVTFGLLPHETEYANPYLKSDMRAGLFESAKQGFARLKAELSTAGGAGTAGYAMIPVYLDPELIDRTRKRLPVVELIRRVTNRGITADYNAITAKGGAFSAAEMPALNETNTTTDRFSTNIKYYYAVGAVSGVAKAAQPSFVLAGMTTTGVYGEYPSQNANDALQKEIMIKSIELKEYEENTIINGNASATATDFSGIIVLQGANNTVDKNTSALGLTDVTTALQYAFDDGGRPKVAIASSAAYGDLYNLITAKIGYLKAEESVMWGYNTLTIKGFGGDIPVFPSMFLSNTSGSKAIYFLDLDVWEMRMLQDATYEALAKTTDADKFMIKAYGCLICKAVDFNSSITEIQ